MGTGHSMILAVNRPWALQHCQTRKDTITQVIDKAPPRVCVYKKYSTRDCVEMLLQHETKPSAVFASRRPRVLYF